MAGMGFIIFLQRQTFSRPDYECRLSAHAIAPNKSRSIVYLATVNIEKDPGTFLSELSFATVATIFCVAPACTVAVFWERATFTTAPDEPPAGTQTSTPIGSRFVAIAVVGGTAERQGPVFENRDIRAITLAHQHQMMTLGR
jgi:hypothetical protein